MNPLQPDQPFEPAPISATASRVSQIIYLIFGIIETLIAIRIILKLLAANPDAGFSHLLYGVTDPFVAFFENVFPVVQSRGSVLEFSSILAIIVYALLGYVIVRLVQIFGRPNTNTPYTQ